MNIPNTNDSSEELTEDVVKINVCRTYGPIEETSVSLLVDESEFKPEIALCSKSSPLNFSWDLPEYQLKMLAPFYCAKWTFDLGKNIWEKLLK